MRDIYGNSWAVIAWLGEEKDESGKAIQLVQRLCDVSKSESATEVEDCLWSNPGHLGHGGWFALNQLMERTYWFRLWIIQEIVMGGPALLIRCGTSCVDWTSFCVGISFLQEHLWIVKDALLHRESALLGQGDMSWATGSLHSCLPISITAWSAGEKSAWILAVTKSALCLDPRDKVYGLIGMMELHISSQLLPNYSLPPSEVYAKVARVFIQGHENLEPIREGNPWGPTDTSS